MGVDVAVRAWVGSSPVQSDVLLERNAHVLREKSEGYTWALENGYEPSVDDLDADDVEATLDMYLADNGVVGVRLASMPSYAGYYYFLRLLEFDVLFDMWRRGEQVDLPTYKQANARLQKAIDLLNLGDVVSSKAQKHVEYQYW